jgi:molecular chaperone DnaK
MAHDNTSLGQFNLDGLPLAPRGTPKIEVSFDIDSNGILNVTARDSASNKSQSIRISASTRLSESEKNRMVEEAERYAEADRKTREDAEKLNAADASCYQAEKMLANFADKLDEEIKKRIETALQEAKQALMQKEVALASERADALNRILQEAGSALYAQSARTGSAGGSGNQTPDSDEPIGGEGGANGKVVDAEFNEHA